MLLLSLLLILPGQLPDVDLSKFHPGLSGANITHAGDQLSLTWPCDSQGETGAIVFNLAKGERLISSIGRGKRSALVRNVDPAVFVTVGTRVAPPGRPPTMSEFNVFFDNPAKRPFETHRGTLALKSVSVSDTKDSAVVTISDVSAGPFQGVWSFTVYRHSPLIRLEAVLRTAREHTAFTYDIGLEGSQAITPTLFWTDTEGKPRRLETDAASRDRAVNVRHRVVVAESGEGSLALFPEPHRFFFPRDYTTNLEHVWFGRGHRQRTEDWGVGIRQTETGGGNFVPWFNAPPGTSQHLSLFLLPSTRRAEDASASVLGYTRGDRFADVPGRLTYTSHWHMAITVDAMKRKDRGFIPDWVRMLKEMNVRAIHLGEFHGDGHPGDPGPIRLQEMRAMFDECKRLSDDRLLVLPGEEANVHFGLKLPGRHPGHYMLLFPKPVAWIMNRANDAPFETNDAENGKVYRIGNLAEMQALVEKEGGLAWTAHPRIKASSWTPDSFKDEPFYKAGTWLGAAWKAMPADLSRERLGERCLDLFSDMANWGGHKYMPGEVDVFKVDHTHELYGHMNINYLELDHLPRFEGGWKPVLDRLRTGRFWTTTGEILIHDFKIAGRKSGETLGEVGDQPVSVAYDLEWTFPIAFVELVSGDGRKVYRDRLPLEAGTEFGRVATRSLLPLKGRTWARLEAWDIAGNGAFTQPVWIGR